ncbi:hypothetical protein [Actinosynnema sp. NPDC020468]|uniref:hypothetical protein n=1 Tax=Actinosynnema sp. NPDC020468 TaxID=3154488 RepID=UPI00341176F4
MTRALVLAALFALLAVLTPATAADLPSAVLTGQSTVGTAEEEPATRECRKAPEPRTCATPARRQADPAGTRTRPTRRHPAAAPAPEWRTDHLRARTTPAALQVFRH